ncbi:LTA synthase family protein [Oceanobacillus halotolerans]|uniref:LTA synthase family protein n=1 Tax=Oceanobacillus halotolerans TaxID=2663380 RepID=UPI0013DC6B7C|nr:LTA synthase family protein [Oceanobacillus halotolerans]
MFEKFKIKGSLQYFAFLFVILLKFILVRYLLFDSSDVLYTIWVELGYILVIFSLIELIPKRTLKTILYVPINLVITLFLLALLIYYNYYGHIATAHAFSQIGQVGAVSDSILQLMNPIYLVLFMDFFLLIIYKLLIKKRESNPVAKPSFTFIMTTLVTGVILISLNINIHKNNEIASTVLAAEKQGLLTYEILAATDTLTNQEQTPILKDGEEDELIQAIKSTKNISPIPQDQRKQNGIAKDKNIIVIQAEAFQDFVVNLEIDGVEVTPFLNQLVEEGLYFPNVYQQIGAGNTSDAEFLFNTSLYPAPWTATSETYGNKAIPSLPKLLTEIGYTSLTFHANEVTFWNRNQLYPALGFDDFYDIRFFGVEDMIGIGPSDEHVYQKAFPELKKLHDNQEPFYAQFVTLSSHHPFKIPEDKYVIDLPERFEETQVGDYIESMSYTDKALKQFADQLKAEGMWEDSILVFFGDHFGLKPDGLSEQGTAILEELIGHEYTFLDQYNIPFVVHTPGKTDGEVIETVGGQIDMMPTLANLMGMSLENHVYFGQDLINYPNNLFGVRYYMPYGSFYNDEINFQPAEGFSDGEAYDLKTGEPLEDFSTYQTDYERILELLELSDNYMKSLPAR